MVQKKYKRSSNTKRKQRTYKSKNRTRSHKFKKTRKIHKRSRKISSTKKSMKRKRYPEKRYRGKRYQRGGAGEDTTVPGDNPGYVGNTYAYGNTVPGSGLWGDPIYITALFSFPEKNKTRVVIQSEQSRRYFTDEEVEFDLVKEDGEHLHHHLRLMENH